MKVYKFNTFKRIKVSRLFSLVLFLWLRLIEYGVPVGLELRLIRYWSRSISFT